MFRTILTVGLLCGALTVSGCQFGPNLTGVTGSGSFSDPFVLPSENQDGLDQGIEEYLEHDGYWTFNYNGITILADGASVANFGDIIYDTRTDTWYTYVDGDEYELTDNAGTYESADCGSAGTCVELFVFDNDPATAQYGTFGLLSEDDETNISVASIYYGLKTPADDMPTTGSATYNGEFYGGIALIDGTLAEFNSTATIDVDFDLGSVDLASTGGSFTLAATAEIDGNSYSSSDVTASYTAGTTVDFASDGVFIGSFFGPAAEETAGAVTANSADGDKFYGAFWGAK